VHFGIFQNWGLGDLVMTTPVIAEFRRAYPDAKLTLVVRGKAQAALMKDSDLIGQILDMPPRSERLALVRFFVGLRHQKFDAAFIGTRVSASLPWLLKVLTGVPVVIGDGEKSRFLYTVRNKIDPDVHRVDRMLATLAMWSGQSPMPPRFPLPRSETAFKEARSILDEMGLQPGQFLVLHPGSSVSAGTDKRIPVDVAKRLADSILRQRPEFSIAYIFGPDEVELISRFANLGEQQVVLSGQSLPITMAIISQAAGLIGTDSSLGHIAASFGVPTITLCGPTIPSETAPYGEKAKVITRLKKLECQPCWGTPLYGQCPYDVRCMNELPESEIVRMATAWDARDLS
jgi:heptosyltransferase-2